MSGPVSSTSPNTLKLVGLAGAGSCASQTSRELQAMYWRFGLKVPWHVQTAQAMRLGRAAAAYVSSNFPKEMELKFEKVAQPFLLLHVNRRATFLPRKLPACWHPPCQHTPAAVSTLCMKALCTKSQSLPESSVMTCSSVSAGMPGGPSRRRTTWRPGGAP